MTRTATEPSSDRPSDPVTLATTVWLGLSALAALADALHAANDLRLFAALRDAGLRETLALQDALADSASRAGVLLWGRLLLLLVTAGSFLLWQSRAIRRSDMPLGPTRAAIEWLIPIVQLWLPYRTMGKLLAAHGVRMESSRFAWWASWLTFLLLGQLALRADAVAMDVSGFTHAAWLQLGSALAAALAAFFAARLVRAIG